MGQFLDKPNTEKDTHGGNIGNGSDYGLSSMQGWRIHMEDAHAHVTEIPDLAGTSFFAIFDGHGGKTVSEAAAKDVVSVLLKNSAFSDAKNKTDPEVLKTALYSGMIELDEKIKSEHEELQQGHDRSGSTAISMFMTQTHYVFNNIGDSRAVLVSNDKVRFATDDHKPTNASELERVKAAGGFVEMGRVCGNLAVSRALGDYEYKDRTDLTPEEQKISVCGDVSIIPRQEKDQFVVMACDGIWDVMSNEQIRIFTSFYHDRGYSTEQIAELLLDHCLDVGSRDNMSALVITLPGAPAPTSSIPTKESEDDRIKRVESEKKALRAEMSKLPAGEVVAPPPQASAD